jgi:hypothetical protein
MASFAQDFHFFSFWWVVFFFEKNLFSVNASDKDSRISLGFDLTNAPLRL